MWLVNQDLCWERRRGGPRGCRREGRRVHSPDGGQTQENVCEGFEGQAGEPVNLSSLCIVISFHNGYNIQTHQEMN